MLALVILLSCISTMHHAFFSLSPLAHAAWRLMTSSLMLECLILLPQSYARVGLKTARLPWSNPAWAKYWLVNYTGGDGVILATHYYIPRCHQKIMHNIGAARKCCPWASGSIQELNATHRHSDASTPYDAAAAARQQ